MSKIFIYSAHEKNNCFKHAYCYSFKEYSTEKVAEMLKESRLFDGCNEIVVRTADENEIKQVCPYHQVINLQPSVDEMWQLRKLINKSK